MRLRRQLVPRWSIDLIPTFVLVTMLPIVYWFELFVVAPRFSARPLVHRLLGTYLLLNVLGNLVAVFMVDTSIQGVESRAATPSWRLCSSCKTLVPPRAWHCAQCRVCILKRDHHCHFTGTCVGHHNQRYFIMFLLHMFIGSLYCTYYNAYFIISTSTWETWLLLPMRLFPMAFMLRGDDPESDQPSFFLLCIAIVVALIISGYQLYCQVTNSLSGQVLYERNHKLNQYNLGWQANVRTVFGHRWYLVWLLPCIRSDLPHDGVHWVPAETHKL